MTRLPLEGVKIIEFSHMVMGPAAGLILAGLGADVIKIELVETATRPAGFGAREPATSPCLVGTRRASRTGLPWTKWFR
jgi:crotonobetainyl-CoA:carnitine CoA-transferase CaiB-like acyl-CoA transferase